MNESTKRNRSSAERLMSTGSGIFFGSPMSATAFAAKLPSSCWAMSQSFEVSAVVVKA